MKKFNTRKTFIAAGGIFLFLFCILPFVWMFAVSFSMHPDFLSSRVKFLFTFDNYIQVIQNNSVRLFAYLTNSLIVSAVSAVFSTLFASLAAYAITRLKFKGRKLVPILLLGFSMFPQISIVGYLFKLLTELRWINTYYALIFPYITMGLPLALWIMLGQFSQLSAELDQAALVDGASRFQILSRIIFPIALPGAFSTFMLIFIYSFNEFLFALMFTIDYHARTIPVGIALFEGLYGQVPWGLIMAASVISIIPVLLIIGFFQKYIIRGLTEGAIKG